MTEIDKIYTETNQGLSIFEHYMGQPIDHNKRYISVFREEKNPSMGFYKSKNGAWRVKDFGSFNMGPIEFVGHLFGLDFHDAKNKIITDLSISVPVVNKFDKPVDLKPKLVIPKQLKIEEKTIITYVKSEWDYHDDKYWGKYLIGESQLALQSAYPISEYTIKKGDKVSTYKRSNANPILYVYEDMTPEGQVAPKIYSPLANDNGIKWIGLTTKRHIQGWKNLFFKEDRHLVICSGRKDYMVLENLLFWDTGGIHFEFCAANSESTLIDSDILLRFRSSYKSVTTLLDWDEAGKKFTEIYEHKHRIPGLNYLLRPYNVKDIAELQEFGTPEDKEKFTRSFLNLFNL